MSGSTFRNRITLSCPTTTVEVTATRSGLVPMRSRTLLLTGEVGDADQHFAVEPGEDDRHDAEQQPTRIETTPSSIGLSKNTSCLARR